MNEIKQTLQQDADALLKRLQQSRKNGTGVTLGVSDVGVLCEVLGGGHWINTNDQLPDLDVLVLIFNPFTFEKMHTAKLVSIDNEFWWFFESDDDYLDPIYTSHWMPLPKEPSHD